MGGLGAGNWPRECREPMVPNRKVPKCKVTGNPCGTDTRPDGCPCICSTCAKWLAERQEDMPAEFARVVSECFWELI